MYFAEKNRAEVLMDTIGELKEKIASMNTKKKSSRKASKKVAKDEDS